MGFKGFEEEKTDGDCISIGDTAHAGEHRNHRRCCDGAGRGKASVGRPIYLAEIKWMHIEENYKWDESLERRLAQCKRALKRDSGPERRAKEVKLESIEERVWQKKGGGGQKAPLRVAWSYAWAMVWMLRSVEAAAVKVRHVKLEWSERKVELTIPKSKMDQAGKGVRRTLACCGASVCGRACAWWLAVRALSEAGSNDEGPLLKMAGGGRCSRLQLVASWQRSWMVT